jgi:hypothetical protein
MRLQIATDAEFRKRHRIQGRYEFAVSFQAYINKAESPYPLCGRVEEEDSSNEAVSQTGRSLRLFKKCISKRKNQDFSQASIECAYRK